MYRPASYAIDDLDVLHGAMRERSFATVAGVVHGRLHFAYVPVVIDSGPPPLGGVRFHLARGNPLAELDGAELRLSFLGPDAYISPDWYEAKGFVPTWNYVAVEAAGRARPLETDEFLQLLVDLSNVHEERLRPKPPWTLDRIPPDRLTVLLAGIRGFAVALETVEGKFKLSQDKAYDDVVGVIAGLDARGDAASRAVARAMRRSQNPTVP